MERPPDRHILLRIGIETGEVIIGGNDVFGHGVNIAHRLTTLAGPGEIIVSARVRDQLTPILDADVEDLGECYLKHIESPLRAYRIGPPGPHPVIGAGQLGELLPTIAVVPFSTQDSDPANQLIGQVLSVYRARIRRGIGGDDTATTWRLELERDVVAETQPRRPHVDPMTGQIPLRSLPQ